VRGAAAGVWIAPAIGGGLSWRRNGSRMACGGGATGVDIATLATPGGDGGGQAIHSMSHQLYARHARAA